MKIGDNIYLLKGYGSGDEIVRIESIVSMPKTFFRSENYSYDYPKEGETHLKIKGTDMWSRISASLETPELIERYNEQVMRSWMYKNYMNIPLEDIKPLYEKLKGKI